MNHSRNPTDIVWKTPTGRFVCCSATEYTDPHTGEVLASSMAMPPDGSVLATGADWDKQQMTDTTNHDKWLIAFMATKKETK